MSAQISQNYTDYKTFLAADRSDAFSMRGALTDVLIADGRSIFLRHLRFDGRLAPQQPKRPHLFSTSSLLDGAEHNRSYWVLGTGDFRRTPVSYPWIVTKSLKVPYGLMLTFDGGTVWGVHRSGGKGHKGSYALFATPRPDPSGEGSSLPDFAPRPPTSAAAGKSWKAGLAARPRAMIRAQGTLLIGGEGFLQMVSASSGETLARRRLESSPVWDGMAAAATRLYVSLEDGSVICLGGKQ